MKTTNKIKAAQSKRVAKKGGNVTDRRLSGLKEAEEKNRLSLEEAKDAFALKAFPLFDNNGRTHGLGDMLLNILKTFGTEPSIAWANAEPFCIDYIECIRKTLTAGAAVYYDTFKYDEKKGVVSSGSTYCICDESKFVNSVVWEVRRYFQNAAIVAKKVESSTFTEWRNGLVIIKKNCFGNSEDRCTDEQASEVVSIIEENCEKLAADVQIWLAEQEGQAEDAKHERSHDFKKRIDEANADIAGRLKQTLDQMTVEAAYTTEEVGAFMRMGAVQVQSLLAEKLMPVLLEATKAIDDGVIDEVEDYDETEPWCVLEDICETWLTRVGQEQFIPTAKEKIEELSRSLSCGKLWYRYDLDKKHQIPPLFLEIWSMIEPENQKKSSGREMRRSKTGDGVPGLGGWGKRWKVGFSCSQDLTGVSNRLSGRLTRDGFTAGLFNVITCAGGLFSDFIKGNDVQIFIFGERFSEYVQKEFDIATRAGITRLVFFKHGAKCDPELENFKRRLTICYATYSSFESLYKKIYQALGRQVYINISEKWGNALKQSRFALETAKAAKAEVEKASKGIREPEPSKDESLTEVHSIPVEQILKGLVPVSQPWNFDAAKKRDQAGAAQTEAAESSVRSYRFKATMDDLDHTRLSKILRLYNNMLAGSGEKEITPEEFLREYNFLDKDGRLCDASLFLFGTSASTTGEGLPKSKVRGQREKAHSAVVGFEANKYIQVKDGESIKIFTPEGVETFNFTRPSYWKVVNRFLISLQKGEDNGAPSYPVPFTCKDNNLCKGDCGAFLRRFTEWEPLKPGSKHHKPWARFKVELLGERKYK